MSNAVALGSIATLVAVILAVGSTGIVWRKERQQDEAAEIEKLRQHNLDECLREAGRSAPDAPYTRIRYYCVCSLECGRQIFRNTGSITPEAQIACAKECGQAAVEAGY